MLTLYILTDGKNYVMDDPIHPGRVMYSTSPVNAKKFTFKQARALLNNKSKKLSWIKSFNMVDDSSGEKIAEQEVRSRSNKGVFVGKNDIDFDVSILDQIMQETNNLLGIAGWNMTQLTTYQNMLSTALSKYDSAEADIEHALQTYKEESGGKKPQAHKMAKVGYLLDDVRDKHKRIKQCQCYIKVMQDAITYHYTLEKLKLELSKATYEKYQGRTEYYGENLRWELESVYKDNNLDYESEQEEIAEFLNSIDVYEKVTVKIPRSKVVELKTYAEKLCGD